MSWGWERWADVRVRLTDIAGRVDQLLARRIVPSPADGVDVVTGMAAMCSRAEAVLLRVGTEHRATLSPKAAHQVCVAVAQLHAVAETLDGLPALLDPAAPGWSP